MNTCKRYKVLIHPFYGAFDIYGIFDSEISPERLILAIRQDPYKSRFTLQDSRGFTICFLNKKSSFSWYNHWDVAGLAVKVLRAHTAVNEDFQIEIISLPSVCDEQTRKRKQEQDKYAPFWSVRKE